MKGMPALIPPTYIVVLGGGGIPSETGLMRTYYGADYALKYPESIVVISLPDDPSNTTADHTTLMKNEIEQRGVEAGRILVESVGVNTHEQAVFIKELLPVQAMTASVLIVTSPTHVRRSVFCFKNEGLEGVWGTSTENTSGDADIGGGAFFRYVIWSRMEVQARVVRELIALGFYKARGWI